MDAELLKAFADLIGAVAWPTVILIVVLTHRPAIGRILDNLESFSLPGGIEGKIRHQVDREARQILKGNPEARRQLSSRHLEAAERVQQLASRTDLDSVRRQVMELAGEYESIRAVMSAGDERTRRMEVVATKLRTFAIAAEPLLPELVNSSSPGELLAAVMVLQVRPKLEYLGWLADRFRVERPFIQYHAGVALLSAARVLGGAQRSGVAAAVRTAKEALGSGNLGTDRWKVLEAAEREVGETSSAPLTSARGDELHKVR